MRNKLYWGLGVLIILFIAISSFVFYQQWTELQQMKKEAAEADKRLEDHLSKPDETIDSSDKPITKDDLPAADPGFKWVQHGDHFHQVPMDAPDEWQGGPHAPIIEVSNEPEQLSVPNKPQYTGERTYEAYEKYVTEAFQNIKRNEFGLPISPLPAAPPAFRNREEESKADRLWNKLSAEYDKSVMAAAIRIDARSVAPEYTGELTYEAYHKYLAERKKLKEVNNE